MPSTRRRLSLLRPRTAVLVLGLAALLLAALPARAQDVDPPVISVTESSVPLADGALFDRAVTPVVDVTDASPVTVDVTLDGAAFTSGTAVSGEGSHLLSVSATDDAGNSASLDVNFEIDTVAPVFVSVAPADGALTAATEITLTGEVAGADAVTVDGQAAALAGDQFSAGPFALAEGDRAFTLVASDAAGNTAQLTHHAVRDATPPQVSLSQPAAGAVVSASPVDVVGSVSDPHLSGVTVNGTTAAVTGGTFVALQVPLAEGATPLTARATDAAGNFAEAQRSVVLDTQPPAVAVTDPAAGTVTPLATLPVSGTATDPHLDRVEVNGVAATLTGGTWSASVPLTEGANDLAVTAWDTVGWSAGATVSVIRDSTAPAVAITAPADGAYLATETVDVSGTVDDEPDVTVNLNGAAATVTGGTWSAPAVPLVEGENRLIARVTDALGNQGARTRIIYRDTVAPLFVAADPADGALAVPPESAFALTFSEILAEPAAGDWRLELADGTPLAATATLAGKVLTVRPDADLPSLADLRLVLTAGLADRAANPLAEAVTLVYTVADVEAPPAPQLDAVPAAHLCASAVALTGTAEAEGVVSATGGAAGATTRAAADGTFSLGVALRPGALNHLEIVVTDRDGNPSPATVVEVIQDCTGPLVLAAELTGEVFSLTFDEEIDAATLGAADGVSVSDASGPLAGTVAALAGATAATFTPDAPLSAGPFRLEVGRGVRDLAGNPLAFPYSQVLGGGVESSFLAGRVLDAATGRPLTGAQLVVLSSDGLTLPEPQPEQTTPGDGRFRIPVPPGTHYLLAARAGYTPVMRIVAATGGLGADVFDPRLTPSAEPVTVGAAGGDFGDPARRGDGPVLEIPAAALAADTEVAVTSLDEQALPALLPYGWSPRGAAWVDLGGATLAADATLSFPVDAADGTALVVAVLDSATLQWTAAAEVTVFDGAVSATVGASHGAASGWVAVEPDLGPPAPPAAVVGTVLGSATAPAGDEATAATVSFDPALVLPAQASRTTVDYTLASDAASGLAVTVTIEEELTLLDGTVRRGVPYQADLVLYRAADGTPRSRFQLRPSPDAARLPLHLGAEDVTVHPYAGETVRGNVLGPLGGTVSDPEGDRVDLPAGALPEPTAVLLARLDEADLPLPVPAGFDFLGHLDLDLSGRELTVAAALTLELGAAPTAGQTGLLFHLVDLGAGAVLRPVAQIVPTASGWTTASIDPQDLPWPGVRQAGRYLFARATADLAYLRGGVYGVGGALAPGALVTGAVDGVALEWVQIAVESGSEAGRYTMPAPLGVAVLTASEVGGADVGSGGATLATADERVDLDLFIQLTGPTVVETVPAHGATGVPAGVEPTVLFSEPPDVSTLAGGVLLYDGADLVPVDLDVQGTLVRVIPRATLRPAAAHELRVTTSVKDLDGNRLDAAWITHFVTADSTTSNAFDRTRIHLFEPDALGMARVTGRSGAVPGGALVFVENLSRFVTTPSVTAAGDGSFDLAIEAGLDDTLLLHIVITGQNEVVYELTPFLAADGRGARVGRGATTFTTLDDVTVTVEEGTFLTDTVVRVDPKPATSPAPVPSDFQVVAAFELDFGGAEAQKPLGIELPKPTGVAATAENNGELLLTRIWRIFGVDYWMLEDFLRIDGDVLTTALPPAEQGASTVAGNVVAGSSVADGDEAATGTNRTATFAGSLAPRTAPARLGDRKDYLPGSANPGLYVVMENTTYLDFAVFPILPAQYAWFKHSELEGMILAVNDSIERLLAYDGILMPTRRGQTYSLEGRELDTGLRFFDATFEPPTPDAVQFLPPDLWGDVEAPVPVAGSPFAFYLLQPSLPLTRELDVGLEMELLASGSPSSGTLRVNAEAGAVADGAAVRLLGLDDSVDVMQDAAADGSFLVEVTVTPGNRYLLALGAPVGVQDDLEVTFSEGLDPALGGIEVRDSSNRLQSPAVEPVGTTQTVRISPRPGWRAGETYHLRLLPDLADGAGNSWGGTLDLPFVVEGSRELDTYELAAVRDVERLGSWLFVAADTDGFLVLDASDPGALANAVAGDVAFPFPYDDPVTSVAVDPHGRVFVAGGGIQSFGQLKIFDPLAFDPAAVAADPGNAAVRYAAFRGSTVVSDSTTTGTSLPEGRPRQLAILSDDETTRWRIGVDPAPAGVTLAPEEAPASGPWTVTVSGGAALPGVAGHPVSFHDLTLGSFQRVDAAADGSWAITLDVLPGDRVELRRNQQSLAYLATLGVGIQVVDVDAFYGEAAEDWQSPDLVSDVIGTYTGFGDPELHLCNQQISDIGSSLVDLDTLFGGDSHPLTLVGLVAFRGLGLFESDPADVGDVSFYGEVCAKLGGVAHVFGLDVVQGYPFDSNDNGSFDDDEYRDYIVVTHRTRGVLVYDATDRDSISLAAEIPIVGQAERVTVDRQQRRLFVSGAGGGIYVVDFDAPLSVDPLDADGDGVDDRVVEVISLPGNTNSPTYVFPELGLAFAGGLDRGVTSVAVGEPSLAAVVDGSGAEGDDATKPRFTTVAKVAPLGVPTAPQTLEDGSPDRPASFRVLAALPGVAGASVRLDVVSLGPGGLPAPGAGDPASLAGLPPAALTGADGLLFTRLAAEPWQEGYQLFLSEPVVAVADLRAAKAYVRTADENDACTRCNRSDLGVDPAAREILSGDSLAVRFSPALRSALAGVYDERSLDLAELVVPSVRWEMSPALRQEPTLNPAFANGEAAPGTLLHSGEFSHSASDLVVRGRGLDFAFTRTYRNQTVGAGPLGPGWDFGYRQRLRELPDGDVEYYDGRGRRELFERRADGGYDAPPGRFVELQQSLRRTSAGWTLLTRHGGRLRFDPWGRLSSLSDPVKDSADTGNEIRFRYDLASRLVEVVDSLDRRYTLGYDAEDRLATVTDFTGRTVTYGYDASGLLSTVTSPAITVGEATFPSGLTTTYAYETSSGDLAAKLNLRDNLASITDAKSQTWLQLTYTDADGDTRADEVTGQVWGPGSVELAYDFTAHTAQVTDRRDHVTSYALNTAGQVTSMTDPLANITTLAYDAEGNLSEQTTALGTRTELTFDTSGGRRARGNVTGVRLEPGSLGRNGSGEFLSTSVDHDPRTNLPSRVTDPRGSVTDVERNFAGLPELIRRGAGSDEQTEVALEYNDRGQPTRLVNGNGHEVALEYFASGPSEGYLRRRIVDPDGLALATRYEYDSRGNVTAQIDPRGVRHEYVYNEMDWLVEERFATTGAVDGAPPLAHMRTYLYDANGNQTESRLPYGDGSGVTRVRATYGPMDEVLTVSAERSTDEWVTESYGYDAALNRTQVTSPEGEMTAYVYDARNLPVSVERGRPGFDPPLTETRTYDAEGRLDTVVDPLGHAVDRNYDGYRRLASVLDAAGNESRFLYDDGGNPVESRACDANGDLLALSRTAYDLLDRPVQQTAYLWEYATGGDPCGTVPASARGLTTEMVYDATGKLVRRTDALGRVSEVVYDAAERPRRLLDPVGNVLDYALDPTGNVLEERTTEKLPDGSTTEVVVEHGYDTLGRRILTRDGVGNETRWFYDLRGNLTGELDAEGYLTTHTYDGLDRRTSTTQPEGLRVELEYDDASRPTVYRDALGNETTWAYDDLGRVTSVTYPDATVRTYAYDDAGNPTRITDPRRTVVVQTFDALNRLTTRAITPSAGVEGPTAESFGYDGLSRLVQAQSGSIVTDLAYDSLSRLLSDATAGRTVRYAYDDLGNEIALEYPSGYRVGRVLDDLDRPTALGEISAWPSDGVLPSLAERAAGFAYRGPGLLAEKVLGPASSPVVTGRMTYDPARRLLSTVYEDATAETVYSESLTWTPRSLKASQTREDLNDLVASFTYDGAMRLTAADRPTQGTADQPDAWTFTYDEAQNLLAKTETLGTGEDAITTQIDLPLDSSGRNRPGSVDGKTLTYDAAGNLIAKGDQTFHWDWSNRLIRAADAGGTVGTYTYDAFSRRVRREVASEVHDTVWAGWQAVEEYVDGTLAERRTFGLGLDEMVLVERDSDGNGTLDQRYRPLYDSIGNVAEILSESGQVIERYSYSPYGERTITVNDLTPPEVQQVRVVGDEVWIELSEAVSEADLAEAVAAGLITLEETAGPTAVPFTWSLPVSEGPMARRRVVITPDAAPAGDTEVRLVLATGALEDTFGNATTADVEETFTWTEGVVSDTTAPTLVQVVVDSAAHLRVTFSEPVDPATVDVALVIDSVTTSWSLEPDDYSWRSDTALPAGSHTVRLETVLADLGNLSLVQPWQESFSFDALERDRLVYNAPDLSVIAISTVGSPNGLHGRSLDEEAGLVYFRNRYLDVELGRFIAADPVGYRDGPSLYQFVRNNPVGFSDPLGLQTCIECQLEGQKQLKDLEARHRQEEFQQLLGEIDSYLSQHEGDSEARLRAGLAVFLENDSKVVTWSQTDALRFITSYFGPGVCDEINVNCHLGGMREFAVAAEWIAINTSMLAFSELASLEFFATAGSDYAAIVAQAQQDARYAKLLQVERASLVSTTARTAHQVADVSVTLDPTAIRFSQSNVRSTLPEIVESMKTRGWQGPPIDVVRMPDGGLVAVDNTRLLAASLTKTPVQAVVREFSEIFPTARAGGNLQGATWGEAVLNRIAGQKPAWRRLYPQGSPFTGIHPSTTAFSP